MIKEGWTGKHIRR